jgi:hypothetical protein
MKQLREIGIVTFFVVLLSGLITGTLLIAQTSLHEVRGALDFVQFDPQVRIAGNMTVEKKDGTDLFEMTDIGGFHIVETSDVAETTDLSSDAEVALLTCNDQFIIQYNNGGVLTYMTIDLDGSDTSWAQSTTAPTGCSFNL